MLAGAGGGDAYTVDQQLHHNRSEGFSHSTGQQGTLLATIVNRQEQEIVVNGIHFPATLSSQHDVNCVLNQQSGKLRTKDIKVSEMLCL